MYPNLNITIPLEKRKQINDKILHIINNRIENKLLDKSVIFNSYSGQGGLHGLKFNNYNSYHAFSEAKKEIEMGEFFTPLKLSEFLANLLQCNRDDLVCDMTAGHGSLINFLNVNHNNIYINELNINHYKVARYLFPNVNHSNYDIRNFNPSVLFDHVIGNPPFNLTLQVGKDKYNSQYFYLLKAYELLKPTGLCSIIIPSSFLTDDFSEGYMFDELRKRFNFIASIMLPRNIFKLTGADIDTKILVFQKKSDHVESKNDNNFNVYIVNELSNDEAKNLHNVAIKSLYEQKEKVKQKIILESNQQENANNSDFNFKVAKMLYHIKVGKNTKKHYSRAEQYLLKFRTQKQENGESYEEWVKRRITEKKVLIYLKRILKNQHKKEMDITRLVKNRYGLMMKAYNRSQKLKLGKLQGVKEISFNNMLLSSEYPFDDKKYLKLYNRKRKEWLRQSQQFSEMKYNIEIGKWLDELTITDYENNRKIKLNDIQKQDTNLMLQKRYGYLQWGTGSGKTISAIAQMLYRIEHSNVRNVFIVAPAIAINNNWNDFLSACKIPYKHIRKLSDVENINRGDIVTITLNMLVKYEKFIKNYIKKQSQKVMLILDEADAISSTTSKRYKSVLKCFRKVKYKLGTSATSTRNNIAESFPAFELLYNNSINMICDAEYIYVENKKTGEIEQKVNEHYNKPFPAYKKGHTLFKRSFNPDKTTVFGVGKQDQNIYNSDSLKSLINKTMITRTFEEVSGKNLYKIIQNTCKFNHAESELYRIIVDEFHQMLGMFGSTGNHRKDAMLRILRQLNSLLDCCSIPSKFNKFKSVGKPSKAVKMLEMLNDWDNDIVAIGATRIKTVNEYARYIREKFPNRPLFIITGESTTMKQRREIVRELKESKNGILLSTQQSLSSSVNIDFVNRILVLELQWNFSSIYQWFSRFIRYTSTEEKEVHFLTVENSIESNLLNLLLNKEKLTSFMRNDEIDNDELYERFGVDYDILSMLMTREKDEDGRLYIQWNNQEII